MSLLITIITILHVFFYSGLDGISSLCYLFVAIIFELKTIFKFNFFVKMTHINFRYNSRNTKTNSHAVIMASICHPSHQLYDHNCPEEAEDE